MAKRRLTVHVRIPPYRPPRNRWRRALYVAALEGLAKARVHYRQPDKLEVHLRLYMDHRSLKWNDVDNRLKDVLDALQGRAGGSKTRPTWTPLIPNDRQVFKVLVEKILAPKQSRSAGHLIIRPYRGARAV